jgi:hypothetical protein
MKTKTVKVDAYTVIIQSDALSEYIKVTICDELDDEIDSIEVSNDDGEDDIEDDE